MSRSATPIPRTPAAKLLQISMTCDCRTNTVQVQWNTSEPMATAIQLTLLRHASTSEGVVFETLLEVWEWFVCVAA